MLRVSYGALGALFASNLFACATAKSSGEGGDQADARIGDDVDAAPRADSGPDIDAATGAVTLTQSSSNTIANANSIACTNLDNTTALNTYYRVFDLSAEGVSGSFDVSKVSFGIESAASGAGSETATLDLYTLDGAFQIENLTQLTSSDLEIADVNADGSASGTIQDVAVTGSAPAGSKLVVELLTPDGSADGNTFYVGSNPDAAPTFLRAPDCGVDQPTAPADVDPSGANMHWVLSVTGTVGS
jgi:hypothetical protein